MASDPTRLSCYVDYRGDGVLRVTKTVGDEGAEFGALRERAGRFSTEHVPGYAGLSFDAQAWRAFAGDADLRSRDFTYPEWTCRDYEARRAATKRAVEEMRPWAPEARVEFQAELAMAFCPHCGKEQSGRICQCENEE